MSNFVRQFKDLRYRIFYGALLHRNVTLLELGNRATGCSWFFCPDGLDADSVIYSGGVGYDVTFEHALLKKLGASMVLFDPSPTGIGTMAKPENKAPQFKFHPVALAGQCGTLKLSPPLNIREGSWFAQTDGAAIIEVPCLDLSTLMNRNGHDHIDLLKIDIEGAEYDVLDDLLKRRLRVKQVLVEFHHNILPGIRRSRTIRTILKMVAASYRLLNQDGNNHTFLHRSF